MLIILIMFRVFIWATGESVESFPARAVGDVILEQPRGKNVLHLLNPVA